MQSIHRHTSTSADHRARGPCLTARVSASDVTTDDTVPKADDSVRVVNIDEILTDLRRDGWATANGKPTDLSSALALHGYRSAHTQRGAARQTLRPLKNEDAPPRSMSARYGLDAQPLHSDGAHLGCVKLRRRSLCGFQAAVAVWA